MSETITALEAFLIAEKFNQSEISELEKQADEYFDVVMQKVKHESQRGGTWIVLLNGAFNKFRQMPPSVYKKLTNLGYTIGPQTTVNGSDKWETENASLTWNSPKKAELKNEPHE